MTQKINLDNYNLNFTLVSHNSDIDSEHQKQVEDYLKQKYGREKVCHIANFTKFGAKTIIKDLCRVFELDFMNSNKLSGVFDPLGKLSLEDELKNAVTIFTKAGDTKMLQFIQDNEKMFLQFGNKLDGLVRQVGRHASGILISNKNLVDSDMPIYILKGEIVSGAQEGGDEREITELGYLKLDILGLIASSVINDTFKKIEKQYKVFNLETTLLNSEFDDKLVYEEFKLGNCRDIFQFGSDSMINLIKRVQPTSIQDLSDINAAFRPAIIQCIHSSSLINTNNGLKQIKDLDVKDKIAFVTDNNKIDYTNKYKVFKKKSKKKLYKITTKSGKTLLVSGKHKILTPNGFYMAKELKISDKLIKIKR